MSDTPLLRPDCRLGVPRQGTWKHPEGLGHRGPNGNGHGEGPSERLERFELEDERSALQAEGATSDSKAPPTPEQKAALLEASRKIDVANRLDEQARELSAQADRLIAAQNLGAAVPALRGAGGATGAYVPRCFSMQSLFDNPPPLPEWRVGELVIGGPKKPGGLIQAAGITGLIGRPKIGKSYSLQQLAFCIAAGVDFLGRKVKSGRVLYIDEEMGKPILFERSLRMRAAHPLFNAPETLDRYFTVSLGGLCVDKPDEIRAEIEKASPDLLIVDAFRRVFRGDENNSAEVAKAMAFFAMLRSEYHIDLVLSHHTRKNLEGSEFWEDAARGSSDFFAACDGLLGLGKRGPGLAELRATLRAAAEPEPINLAFNEETTVWEPTTRQADSAGFDSLKAFEEILLSKPGRAWPQKLVEQGLRTQYGRTEKQAEKALAKIPTFKAGAEPPLDVRIFKRVIPGTRNEREIVLTEAEP